MISIADVCKRAKEASQALALCGTEQKNKMLNAVATALRKNQKQILSANAEDVREAEKGGKASHFIDRLTLTDARIRAMADGAEQVAALADPIGEVLDSFTTERGLSITKVRVPLGVVGIIYEARPNVTIDTAALCIKSGNAVVLRGSKDAICSNTALVRIAKQAIAEIGEDPECIQLIEDTSREGAVTFMTCSEYVDVLVPRGSAGLISTAVQTATIPVIETGTGNCHVFIDESAPLEMAASILLNAKTTRPSVCNSCESVLIHRALAPVVASILAPLTAAGVEIRGCEKICALYPAAYPAAAEDYAEEYLNLTISAKIVDNIGEAIAHISRYGTKHSETIVTQDENNAQRFLAEIDAAAVYVNASTRFTDGFEFGFGAELGISTQKLHARGPIGLKELTSYKYRIRGNGQIRE